MPFIEQLGQQAAGGLLGAGMGLLLQGHNDERQLRQQQRLQALQMQGNREMMDYSYMKQLQMWKDTNYRAQIQELKAAGLNPALLYGKSGPGGVTGSPTGSVQGANAPIGGGEIPTMMGMGMQLQLLKAQKENIEADTKNKEAQATKTAGVDTKKQEIDIQDVAENIKDRQLRRDFMRIEMRLEDAKARIQEGTIEEQIFHMTALMTETQEAAEQAKVKTFIDKATQNQIVDTVKLQLATLIATKGLIQAQTQTEKGKPALQAAELDVLYEQAQDILRKAQQKWREIEMGGEELRIRSEQELRDELKATGLSNDYIDKVVDFIILKKLSESPTPKTPTKTQDPNFKKHQSTDDIDKPRKYKKSFTDFKSFPSYRNR